MSVHVLLWIALGLLLVAAAAFTYVNESVNAEARQQDDVLSVCSVVDDAPDFFRALGAITGHRALSGNEVRVYQNGDEIFPPMLRAIDEARESVHLATYVYERGEIPDRFARAFEAAARRGVEVRVVLDRHGAKTITRENVSAMRAAGCDVRWFRRAQWYDWEKYNRRTHRRALVVDGTIAFTGGVGISDRWSGRGDGPGHWRDTHVEIRGPAVADLQATFLDTWNEATGQLTLASRYFPVLDDAGTVPLAIVQSNPANATSAAQRTIAALIAGSRRSLLITNAYFVPGPPFVRALVAACARGVDVKVVMPGPFHNKPAVRRASRYTWGDLLRGGVKLYEHQLTMVHAKVIVVDGRVALVGSINFDPRSFVLNAECAAAIHDERVAQELTIAFEADVARSRRVTPDDLAARSVIERTLDAGAYWVRGQL